MTTIGRLTAIPNRLQSLPQPGQSLREVGQIGAFENLFAEKASPEPPEAVAEADAAEPEETAEADGGESSTESEQEADGSGGPPTAEEAAAEGEIQAVDSAQTADGGVAGAIGHIGVGQSGKPASNGLGQGEQVAAQLKHAATVNLADLARREMLGRPVVDGIRPPPPPQADRPQPNPGGTTGGGNDSWVQNGGTAESGGRGASDRLDLPRPIDGPDGPVIDTVKSDPVGGHPGMPHGKSPNVGDPLTASNQARQAGDSNNGNANQQTAQAVGKAVFLDRLAEQASARRGAVASVDRAAMPLTDGRTPATRANVQVGQAQPGHAGRDAFLAPVQKGLAKMLAQGGGRMTVLLNPERLGEVKVRMETGSGSVRVRMEAGTEAARQTLESGIDALRATLEARGVRVESIEIQRGPGGEAPLGSHGDADAQSGGNDRRELEHRGTDRHSRDELDAAESDPVRGILNNESIWTELGIDAVA